MPVLHRYANGNATVELHDNGTRIVQTDDAALQLDFPLNIDIRLSERCAFGYNPKTRTAVCDFCHESATTDGADGAVSDLMHVLDPIPAGVELAVGINQYDEVPQAFLPRAKARGWVVNATVNMGLVRKYEHQLKTAIDCGLIRGVGISYRPGMAMPDPELLNYPNTIMHVITGIDSIETVLDLANKGVKKILVLGEKDFGFNASRVDLKSPSHIRWYRHVFELFGAFDVVSFDNLAVEQLNVQRFVKNWNTVYQGEHSMYINAVRQYFSPSSRSPLQTPWDSTDILSYFKSVDQLRA